MEAIGLIEFRVHRHTLEKKRIERQMVEMCKLGKDLVERALVLLSPIWRGKHAEQQHLCAGSLNLTDHLIEIVAHGRRLDAAQRVVGAEREDDEVGLVGERPVE